MSVYPISVSLRIQAFDYRDGDEWVVVCPALRLAAQGRTRREARLELSGLISANLDLYHQRGVLDEVLREAALEPSSMVVPSSAKPSVMDVAVPVNLLAGRHVQARKAA